ncbi:MAG: GNAT family N-acetyltransferase, partial [Jannaschia sp.]
LHAFQAEPGARRFARTPEVPSLAAHAAWFDKRLRAAPGAPFYMVEHGGAPCGFVRLDPGPSNVDPAWEVSILLTGAVRGRGRAHAVLALLRLTHPTRHIVAHVHPDNSASQRLFSGAGYVRTGTDSFVSPGWAELEQERRRQNDADQ